MPTLLEKAIAITKDHAERLKSDPDLARLLDERMDALAIMVPLEVSLTSLAKALRSHGMELHATTRGTIEVRYAELTREQALELNLRNAGDYRFMPADGYCYCGADLVAQYRIPSIAAGYSVTGCRKCHRSFVD